jgi:hypothetical protein
LLIVPIFVLIPFFFLRRMECSNIKRVNECYKFLYLIFIMQFPNNWTKLIELQCNLLYFLQILKLSVLSHEIEKALSSKPLQPILDSLFLQE